VNINVFQKQSDAESKEVVSFRGSEHEAAAEVATRKKKVVKKELTTPIL